MRLSRVQIENHSRIANLDVRVDEHLVLIGANDVGKSSILRLLNLLLGSSTAQLYSALGRKDLRSPDTSLKVTATLVALTDAEKTVFHRELDVDPSDRSLSLQVRLEVSLDPDDPDSVVITRWSPGRGEVRALRREQLDALGWRFLAASRGTSAALLDGTSGAVQVLLRAVQRELGSEREVFASLLSEFNSRLDESDALAQLRQSIASHLSGSMPRMVSKDDLSVRTTADPDESVLENVSVFLAKPGADEPAPLSEQSDGIRQLMAMALFDLAQGSANIIAVDEPELHLHPQSQRTVAKLLQSQSTQKILATHSPYVVQRFEPKQVVAVSPDGQCSQLAQGNLSIGEKVQAHWWSPTMLEALTARVVIMVEGIADRLVVEGAAAAMSMPLDKLGVMIFELDGAENFRSVYRLLGPAGFGIEVVGLVDEAESPGWLGAVGGKRSLVEDHTIFICRADLEDEYSRGLGASTLAGRLIDAGSAKEQGILSSCGAASMGDLQADAVAAFCRGATGSNVSRKVPSAIAVRDSLTASDVASIGVVSRLLARVRELTD